MAVGCATLAKVDKVAREQEEANQAGDIEVTLANLEKTVGLTAAISLNDAKGSAGCSRHLDVWTHVDTISIHYALKLDGKTNGKLGSAAVIIEVRPGRSKSR